MKILVISKSFFPIAGPRSSRATELVKELSRKGNDVTVVAPRKSIVHDQFEKDFNVKVADLGTHFFSPTDANNLSFFKKVLLKILMEIGMTEYLNFPDVLYYFKTKKKLRKYRDYDLVISIAKPHSIHWGVADALVKDRRIARKWIADCGDPFMSNPFRTPAKFFEKHERNFCRIADFITVPVKEAIGSYYPEYRNKIKVIPQGFDLEKDKRNILSYTPNPITTFAYAGAFYKDKRDPRKFLEFLLHLNREYRFIIYSSNFDLVRPYAEKADGKIELRNYVPRQKLLGELSKMDFLINVSNISSVQSPSKLIDYYIVGRPVLTIENGSVDPIKLNKFLNGNYEDKHKFESVEKYDIKYVAQQFLML